MWRNVLKIVAPDDDDDDGEMPSQQLPPPSTLPIQPVVASHRRPDPVEPPVASTNGWDHDDDDENYDDDMNSFVDVDVDSHHLHNVVAKEEMESGWDADDVDIDDDDVDDAVVVVVVEDTMTMGVVTHDSHSSQQQQPPLPTNHNNSTSTPPPQPQEPQLLPTAVVDTKNDNDHHQARPELLLVQQYHQQQQMMIDALQSQLQQQQEQLASLAEELISTVQERNLLQDALTHHTTTVQQLQEHIRLQQQQQASESPQQENNDANSNNINNNNMNDGSKNHSNVEQQNVLLVMQCESLQEELTQLHQSNEEQISNADTRERQLLEEVDQLRDQVSRLQQHQETSDPSPTENDTELLQMQCESLQEELTQLHQSNEEQARDFETRERQLVEQVDQLRDEVAHLPQHPPQHETDNNTELLQMQCESLQDEMTQLHQSNEEQVREFETRERQLLEQVDQLREEVSRFQQQQQQQPETDNDTELLQMQYELLQDELTQLHQSKEEQVRDSDTRERELLEQVDQLKEEVSRLQQQARETIRTKPVENDTELLQMQYDLLQDELMQLHQSMEERVGDADTRERQLMEQVNQLQEEVSRRQQLQEEVSRRQQEENEAVDQFQTKCSSLQHEITQLHKVHEDQLQDFDARERELIENGDRLQEVIIRLQNTENNHHNTISQLQSECNSLRQSMEQINVIREENAALKDLSNQQQLRILSLEQDQKNSKEKIYQLQYECDALRQDMEDCEKEFEERVLEDRERHDQLSNEHRQLSQQFQQLQEENTALKEDVSNQQQRQITPVQQTELEIIRSRFEMAIQERDTYSAENEELYVQLGYMKTKLDAADELSMQLQAEVKTLQIQLDHVDLEQLSSSERSLLVRNTNLDQQIQTLMKEKEELIRQLDEQQKRIDEYQNSKYIPAEGQLEVLALREQLTAKDRLIQMKVSEIQTLQERLEMNHRPDPLDPSVDETTAAMEAVYQEKILDLEMKCNNLCMELETVKSQLETTEGALLAKDQLYNMRSAMYDLETNENHVSRVVDESEAHIRELEAELQNKTKYVCELQDSVSNMKCLLEEIDVAKENEMALTKKDSEIESLKNELASIQIKLSTTEEQLQRIVGTTEGIAAANQMNHIEYLRSNIVAVALALEQSEMNRADTLERLVSEREAYAVHLRSMSDKLKRFYSTITFGDA